MYDIYDLVMLFPFILVLVYWWRSSEQKLIAVAAARRYCKERNLQMLDETLVFKKLSIGRDTYKRRQLCRHYEFDYCLDGQDRHSGEIILSGNRVLRIILQSGALESTEFDN